jgi:hypothetical protein
MKRQRKGITMPRKPNVAKSGQVKALEAIQAAGALNRFEEQMFGLALFEHRFGDAQIAEHIFWCLAQATGVPI